MTAERAPELGVEPRVPKYYRLKKHLVELTEALPPGSPLPPERSLAEKYGWADRFVSILGDHSVSVPTRLDPREG